MAIDHSDAGPISRENGRNATSTSPRPLAAARAALSGDCFSKFAGMIALHGVQIAGSLCALFTIRRHNLPELTLIIHELLLETI